jgi:outer membrane lipoprotein-sorting protein
MFVAVLRLGSTRRVIGLCAGAVLAIVALAVLAGAALGGRGEAPPQRPLANAVQGALSAPAVPGIHARVTFKTNLFGGATTDMSSALLKGGSGRLWATKDKLRLELQSDNGDAQIVVDGGKGYVYDGPSDTAYTFTLPARSGAEKSKSGPNGPPSLSDIAARLAGARQNASISGATPGVVAGEPAYTVRVTPREHGGLLGAAELAWDATRGVPLRIALYARGQTTPTVEIAVTDISFGSVGDSVFAIPPPAGAKKVDLTGGGSAAGTSGHDQADTKSSFTANAPASLSGRARREVKPHGHGAIVLYGKGLDTIVVFERKAGDHGAQPAPAPKQNGDGQQPLELPSVSINGAKATALGTPLGGFVSFERGGVAYTVAGSQPLSVLQDAARGL